MFALAALALASAPATPIVYVKCNFDNGSFPVWHDFALNEHAGTASMITSMGGMSSVLPAAFSADVVEIRDEAKLYRFEYSIDRRTMAYKFKSSTFTQGGSFKFYQGQCKFAPTEGRKF